MGLRLPDCIFHVPVTCHVTGNRKGCTADLGCDPFNVFCRARGQHDVGTQFGEFTGGGLADTAACTGYHGGFIGKVNGHGIPPTGNRLAFTHRSREPTSR